MTYVHGMYSVLPLGKTAIFFRFGSAFGTTPSPILSIEFLVPLVVEHCGLGGRGGGFGRSARASGEGENAIKVDDALIEGGVTGGCNDLWIERKNKKNHLSRRSRSEKKEQQNICFWLRCATSTGA